MTIYPIIQTQEKRGSGPFRIGQARLTRRYTKVAGRQVRSTDQKESRL